MSRFVSLDAAGATDLVSVTDYGRVYVHRRTSDEQLANALMLTREREGEGDDAKDAAGIQLFKELPPLPRGARAGPSLKGGPVRCAKIKPLSTGWPCELYYAGREIDVTRVDVERNETTWKAKNIPHSAAKLVTSWAVLMCFLVVILMVLCV